MDSEIFYEHDLFEKKILFRQRNLSEVVEFLNAIIARWENTSITACRMVITEKPSAVGS